LEIKLGLFEFTREIRKDEIIVPSLALNYGILENCGVLGGPDVQVFE
jgi:hypothetical protein